MPLAPESQAGSATQPQKAGLTLECPWAHPPVSTPDHLMETLRVKRSNLRRSASNGEHVGGSGQDQGREEGVMSQGQQPPKVHCAPQEVAFLMCTVTPSQAPLGPAPKLGVPVTPEVRGAHSTEEPASHQRDVACSHSSVSGPPGLPADASWHPWLTTCRSRGHILGPERWVPMRASALCGGEVGAGVVRWEVVCWSLFWLLLDRQTHPPSAPLTHSPLGLRLPATTATPHFLWGHYRDRTKSVEIFLLLFLRIILLAPRFF